MNVRFGLYFIPEGAFYQAGSSVVGYDVRGQREVDLPDFIDPAWHVLSGQYGFHATITDAIIIAEEKLPEVMAKAKKLLECFDPANRYLFTKDYVGFWSGSNQAALVVKPNRNVEMLHDVLVASLHPLGTGSEYTQKQGRLPDSPAAKKKLETFYSPYIFDDFAPHFTCFNPYSGPAEAREEIEAKLETFFGGFNEIEMNRLAFVVQKEGEAHFRIEKELSLHGE